jgi:hypothetical protein
VRVSFRVYGTSYYEMRQRAVSIIEELGLDPSQLNIQLDVTENAETWQGDVIGWRADVVASPRVTR